MNRSVYILVLAQFFTAFADNAILFTIIEMVLQAEQTPAWYIPALQSAFFVAYVVLAPWVGPFADQHSKPRVLIIGNILKAAGVVMIFMAVDPLIAYAIVGLGAAVYGPAKYGVLPELVHHSALVKANGWVEGSTILAIILGMVGGAYLARESIQLGLLVVIVTYAVSIAVTLLMPRVAPRGAREGAALPRFVHLMRDFFVTPRARFAMLGSSLFWGSSAVLRVLLIAWAPVVLLMKDSTDIAMLTLFLAIGIVFGAALVPRLIPIERLRRARLAAYVMGLLILWLSFVDSLWMARGLLFAIGIAGGLFVVPVNAALQEIGHKTVGSGGAVAIQNFFQNLAMLLAVGFHTMNTALGLEPVSAMVWLGAFVLSAAALVSWHLPPDPAVVKNND